jgi:predicted transcriptional regulator YheO
MEKYGNLCVDHYGDKVRGLLCVNCNVALGKLGDSPEKLARALAYVKGTYKNMEPMQKYISKSLAIMKKKPDVRSVVTFVTPTVTVKVTRQRRVRKNAKQKTFLISEGSPNFLERRMLNAGKIHRFPLVKTEEFAN